MTPLEFRDVRDGDRIPAHCFRGGGIHGASLFAWACPSLTEAEAEALGRRADGMAVSAKAIRDFITSHIASVCAELACNPVPTDFRSVPIHESHPEIAAVIEAHPGWSIQDAERHLAASR